MGGREKRVRLDRHKGEGEHRKSYFTTLLLYYFMTDKETSIKINEELKWKLKEIATKEKKTIKAIVEEIVSDYIDNYKDKIEWK